eukprot:CAMPEP_0197030564 /NCGR_PEP_ID=MMETSP1384-20130603/9779_1 /TAXON_ID=29189 /ORGANISM="Ammonia sp." /LENGTH=484 /DNA_ID=CAMNT_0042459945 /DNA_START=54 /DNA_END=1508 /DNA_ORIENTATION=-
MGASITLITIFLILHCSTQSLVNYTDFKTFPLTLPIPLQEHIATVYNNKLFIIGGRNDTIFGTDASPKAWSLDLSALNLQLTSTKTDITVGNTAVQWQQLSIANPTYGPITAGFIRCTSQCYTQIGPYLYIAAPYGKTDTYNSALYRLDLSQSPPVYATDTELGLAYNLGNPNAFGNSVKEPCLTASADGEYLYLVGGNINAGGTAAENYFLRLNVSTNEWVRLTNMNQNRQSAGCAANYNDEEVYIFGGKDDCNRITPCSSITGSVEIDTYFAATASWTDNEGYLQPELSQPKSNLKCINNPYDESIICPGGSAQSAYKDTTIYRTPQKAIIDTIELTQVTTSYGIATYEFINNGVDQAFILFVTGGGDQNINVYDSIQYTVIANVPTDAPTAAPTDSPSMSPSAAPTDTPTAAPSNAPVQPPTAAPTEAPTVPLTTMAETRQGTVPPKETEEWGIDPPDAVLCVGFKLNLLIVLIVVIIVLI